METEKRYTRVSFHKAFTLAEVLIALVVIGLVSSLVIPVMMDYVHKDMMAIALRKAYSTINQTLPLMTRDFDVNGNMNDTGLFNGSDSLFGDNLVRYLKVAKNCQTNSGCFPASMGTEYPRNSAQVSSSSVVGNHYSFVTNDNMAYMVESTGAGCLASYDGASSLLFTRQLTQICGKLWVDVNAFKPPNTFGNDIFLFYITNGVTPSLYPAGGRDDAKMRWSTDGVNSINCNSSNKSGYACAGRIMDQSWQINY